MEIMSFNGCCKARIIVDFGGGEEWSDEDDTPDCDELLPKIQGYLEQFARQGIKLVFATTTSSQIGAIEALTRLGFNTHENAIETTRHEHTGEKRFLQGWMLPMNEYKP